MSVDKILPILNFSFPNFVSANSTNNNTSNNTVEVSKVKTLPTVKNTTFASVGNVC